MKTVAKEDRGSRAKALIYARADVLTSDGGDSQGEARPASDQVKSCEATAARLGVDVVQEYVDLGFGANERDRPGLSALMERLHPKRSIDYVIVSGLDRLARNQRDLLGLIQTINYMGALLVIASDTPQPKTEPGEGRSSPSDELLRAITLAMAELDHRHRSEAAKRGWEKRRANRLTKTNSQELSP